MKLTKGMFKKLIKEEIEELSTEMRWGGYSDGLRDILVQLERMIPIHLGVEDEDFNVTVDEWGPAGRDEPAGGEIRVSWESHPIEAYAIAEASLADESPLEKAKYDHFTAAHEQAAAAANGFEELARQDETGLMHDIQRKYIDLFKSGGNEFGDLGPLAIIAIANAYSLVNK
tara:strand:- start:62 stop:577 length:516 start_codon:yes stop_codon:yes gene_type:complete